MSSADFSSNDDEQFLDFLLDTGQVAFSDDSSGYFDIGFEDIDFNIFPPDSNIDTGQIEISSQISYPEFRELSVSTTHNSSFQQYTNRALFDNSNLLVNNSTTDLSFRAEHRAHKRKVNLSENEQQFKDNFYSTFTKKKKFPKPLVKKIHKLIEGPLNLSPFTRSYTRFNDLYFKAFSAFSDKIINYLYSNKQQIINSIPELNNLPK